ncbi:hypothetical protein GQX74_008248 [Glossina fuscipes]|nr:hypothetical protein GQX74_008248 [Glossina fuscipes]
MFNPLAATLCHATIIIATLSTLLVCLPLAIWAFPMNVSGGYEHKYCNKSVHNGGSCFHASVKLIVKREKKRQMEENERALNWVRDNNFHFNLEFNSSLLTM